MRAAWLTAALAALLLAGAPRQLAAAAPSFPDVPPGSWAAADISALAGQGLLQGTGGGLFSPDLPLTRAAFAALLERLAQPPAGTVGPSFSDVPADAWFAGAVAAATGLGWMQGVAPGQFAPEAPVSRAMAAAAVINDLGLAHVAADEAGAALPYADAATIPAYAAGAVAVATHLGLLLGDPQGRLQPNAPLTRAEGAALLVRLEGVSAAQLQAEGARVAAVVDVTGPAHVEAGATAPLQAFARDAAGYIVPAAFHWTASPGLTAAAGSLEEGAAALRPAAPGALTIRASVAGGTPSGGLGLQVTQTARLSLGTVPPAVLAADPLPLPVRALTAAGGGDAAGAQPVTAVATPAAGGSPVSATVTLAGGAGTLQLPPLAPGAWSIAVSAPGLPALTFPLTSLAAPLGTLQLEVEGGGAAAVAAGGTIAVRATILATPAPPVLPASSGEAGAPALAPPPGPWPLQVSVAGTQTALPALAGESKAPQTLAVHVASADLPAGGGAAAILTGLAPGAGSVTVAVPGGALGPASLPLQVLATGAFGATTTTAPAQGVAGQPAAVSVALTGGAASGTVDLEPVDPAGHPLPEVRATVAAGRATAVFTPLQAGTWTFRWREDGVSPVAAGSLPVRPAAAASLRVDPLPTSVLLPGQTATLRAYAADAYGNPAPVPFTLSGGGLVAGTAAAGALQFTAGALSGPAAVGTFTAGAAGSATYAFTAPGLGSAQVTLRTVATAAGRIAGKGGWLIFPDWRDGSDAALLAEAAGAGYTHVYLEVATTSDGFYGGRALDDFLPPAHAAGLAVIAWVYAGLEHPAADTALLQQVAAYTTPQGDRADGVALDLEEVLTPGVVAAYSAAAHQAEGPQGLVVAVTYPPEYGPATPFAALAPNVQAVAPMDYWHVRQADYSYDAAYRFVAGSVAALRQEAGLPDLPVEVIAQTYDAFAGGAGQGIFSPSPAELAGALAAASASGAAGVSFYRPATATPAERAVMAAPWPG